MNQYGTIHDLIRTAMQRLSAKTGTTHISKKKILKVLYLAKGRMQDCNPIKENLAYYWYLEGPYSEVVYEGIDHLVSNGMVTPHKTQTSETYQFDSNRIRVPLVQSDEHVEEARKCISEAVDGFSHIEGTVGDIYDDAPYAWYKTYKQGFKVKFDSFCNAAGRGKPMYGSNDILNVLDDAVLDFPPLPEFVDLRLAFMDFAKILNAFLRSEYLEHQDKFGMLQKTCDEIWAVFAHGVRVKCHDAYYDIRADDWDEMYKAKLSVLDKDIRRQEKIFGGIASDDRRFVPEIEDVVLHPEGHTFKPITTSMR